MHFKAALVILTLLVLQGCSIFATSPQNIRVTVSNIEVGESTMLEQTYLVTLRLQNHGDRRIDITGGSFNLDVNGQDFASGVSNSPVAISAYSDALIEVRMVSTLFGMLRVIQSLQNDRAQQMEYEISGRVSVKGRPVDTRFQEQGGFSFPATTPRRDRP